jgi:hypothetical protein
MAQVVATHYIDWRDSNRLSRRRTSRGRSGSITNATSRYGDNGGRKLHGRGRAYRVFAVTACCWPRSARRRVPDVSRESLENAITSDWSISRYDILPDRIVVYMWSRAGGTKFQLQVQTRYGINAQTRRIDRLRLLQSPRQRRSRCR